MSDVEEVDVIMMSNARGEHLNCDLDHNDPEYVCVGHNGVKGLYQLDLAITVKIQNHNNNNNNDRAIIMAHISRPSHNHRLLNSQVEIVSEKERYSLPILIRKEAPCDVLLFLELWMTSQDEPFSFEAYGSIPIKTLLLEEDTVVELKDVSGAEQGHLSIQRIKSSNRIDLLKTCSHPGSLSNNRNKFQMFLKSYHEQLIEEYKRSRPGDNYHWYTTVQCSHEQVALGTIVYMTRHVSFPIEGSAHIWLLLFGLAWMEVFKGNIPEDPRIFRYEWNHVLTDLQRAKVINYMFTLPLTGSTYVVDRVRGPKGLKMDTDIWSFLRSRPYRNLYSGGSSFDCEDASLYMMESIFVFKNSIFEDVLLCTVQQTLIKEYNEWFTLCMLKVQGSQYEAHAVVVLEHNLGHPIILEGTCLTSGVWNDLDTEDEKIYYKEGEKLFFGELYKLDDSIAWKDMIQYSTPRCITKEDVLYKTPMTAVCTNKEEVIQRVFQLQETMNDAMHPSSNSEKILGFKDHPLEPPEFQPVSWFDCTTVSKEYVTDKLHVYRCACGEDDHESCWFYYTSIEFYEKHKQTISKALSNEKYTDVQIFNAGREVCFVRICVCRL